MKKVLFIFLLIFLACPIFVFALDKIDINTASLSQIDQLTGIGPVYAQRIIDGRPYSSIDDLDRVKGIGPKILQKIKDQGLACVNCAVSQNSPIQEETAQTPQQSIEVFNYPSGIFINEILPNPKGSDETDEYIELYNSNNFEVNLSGWQLQDKSGTTATFTIPQANKIMADGFLVFKRPETKIMLNNDADGLDLLTPDKKVVDSVNFISAPLGQSYNKTPSEWQWSISLTPGSKNIVISSAIVKTSLASSGPNNLPKTENSVKNNSVEPGLADISQSINQEDIKTSNPWFLFFMVLAVTIILAATVVFIKIKFKN